MVQSPWVASMLDTIHEAVAAVGRNPGDDANLSPIVVNRADVTRINILTAVKCEAGERSFSLADLPALKKAVAATAGCKLVVIDPLTAYLGTVDSHKNAEIRGLLKPLADMAARLRVAVAAVTHLNKNAGIAAVYRTMGSVAFAAAARAVWAVSRDKEDPARRFRTSCGGSSPRAG